jgi:Anti-sigma factor NepR
VYEPTLPSQVTTCLGERLRAHYSVLMNDPVPEHLIRILEALDETRSANGGP